MSIHRMLVCSSRQVQRVAGRCGQIERFVRLTNYCRRYYALEKTHITRLYASLATLHSAARGRWGQIERFRGGDQRCGGWRYGTILREPLELMHALINYDPRCARVEGQGGTSFLRSFAGRGTLKH